MTPTQPVDAIVARIREAVAKEREACAMAAWEAIMNTTTEQLLSRDMLVHNTVKAIRARTAAMTEGAGT